ncbi:unnamed protein product [Tenebrio molitor]|nr:unnamed protein product [Tenebrio molitor]
MKPCCVPGCENIPSRRYFIPREIRIQKIWIGLEPKYVGKSFVVYEKHFSPICKDARGRLLKNALPTINLPGFKESSGTEDCFSHPQEEYKYVTPEKIKGRSVFM